MKNGPYKIGIVCYPTHGGSGVVAAELGRHLARRGHTIHFISHSRPFRLMEENHENIFIHPIQTVEYPLFLGALYGISASVGIYDVIREHDLDVLHVHYALPHAVCAFLANEMIGEGRRVPVLTSLHGTDITLVGNLPSFQPAVKFGLDKSDGLTCVSNWLSDRTCRHFDICERLNVIYNFVDPEIFQPGRDQSLRSQFASGNEALLLHVSNFRPVKRVGDVIRAFAGVCEKVPARLLLVGDGPDREGALKLAEELGVAEKIIWLGERQEVRDLFAVADLFLFPSDGESFGLAAAEAMACETPVIGARAGGLPEVVLHGENGFLHPVGDHEGMARSALELLRNPAKRTEMGKASRQRIIDHFSPDLIIPQYENCYASLMRRAAQAALPGAV